MLYTDGPGNVNEEWEEAEEEKRTTHDTDSL
jgi:hypothetical protein